MKATTLMPYNSWADVVHLLAEWYDTKSNIKLDGFWSQLQAFYVSSHTEELWYNKTVCLWMTKCIYVNFLLNQSGRILLCATRTLYSQSRFY